MKFTKLFFTLFLCSIFCFIFTALAVKAETKKGGEKMSVAEGKKISIEYTLSLENKEVVDTNVGKEPLTYVQGSNHIIPGLENALTGLVAGDSKNIVVKPEDAYGPVAKEAIVEVGKDNLPQELWKVGAPVQYNVSDGRVLQGRVTEIKDDVATIDFNHPLAGKTLYFDVKVLDVQ